jgi:hypothetical protein
VVRADDGTLADTPTQLSSIVLERFSKMPTHEAEFSDDRWHALRYSGTPNGVVSYLGDSLGGTL